jgi:hypothetical protein
MIIIILINNTLNFILIIVNSSANKGAELERIVINLY